MAAVHKTLTRHIAVYMSTRTADPAAVTMRDIKVLPEAPPNLPNLTLTTWTPPQLACEPHFGEEWKDVFVAHKDFFKSEVIRMLGKLEAGESLDQDKNVNVETEKASSSVVESRPKEHTPEKREKQKKTEKKEKVFRRRPLTPGAMPLRLCSRSNTLAPPLARTPLPTHTPSLPQKEKKRSSSERDRGSEEEEEEGDENSGRPLGSHWVASARPLPARPPNGVHRVLALSQPHLVPATC